MVQMVFPKDFNVAEYLKSQFELYYKYKKDSNNEVAIKVIEATAAYLEMWHNDLMTIEWNYNISEIPHKNKEITVAIIKNGKVTFQTINCLSLVENIYAWTNYIIPQPSILTR